MSCLFYLKRLIAKQYIRFGLLLSIALAIFIVKYTLINGWIYDHDNMEENVVEVSTKAAKVEQEPFEVFIRSAYYYPTSKSLGNNHLAFVIMVDFTWPEKVGHHMTIRAWNKKTYRESKCKLEIMNPWHDRLCKLIGMFSDCEGIANMQRLEVNMGGEVFQEVPFETIWKREKKDVVACISPLFAAERWQLLTFAVHNWKRFGGFMHLYVRSMVRPIFDLMKIYEKEGYLKLDPWIRIKFTSIPEYMFNPNQHLAFRSQEAAQTDCLLQYKESAEFVMFVDLDDIFIPRLGPTYLEEFQQLMPGYDFIHYHKENSDYEASMYTQSFSMEQIFGTIRFKHVDETGKYATRPHLVNYTTIHFPTLLKNPQPRGNGRGHMIDRDRNVIMHLKYMSPLTTPIEEQTVRPYEYNDKKTMIFNETDVKAIQKDFKRMFKKYSSVWQSQPSTTYYSQHIDDCFQKKYYYFWVNSIGDQLTHCPNPDMCKLPQLTKVPCANADAVFFSTEHGTEINVHWARSRGFSMEDKCMP